MKNKLLAIILMQILVLINLSGCAESKTDIKYTYLSHFFCETGEQVTSTIKINSEGNPVVFNLDGSSGQEYTFDILSGEAMTGLPLETCILNQISGVSSYEMFWENYYPYYEIFSDIYFEDDGGFICYINHNTPNEGEGIVGFDESSNMIYNIDV